MHIEPPHPDGIEVLSAIARGRSEPADLTLEAWVLGFSDERMNRAVDHLLAEGFITLDPGSGASRLLSRQARLTDRAVALLRQLGFVTPILEERNRRAADRAPPEGERRRERDRRATSGEHR